MCAQEWSAAFYRVFFFNWDPLKVSDYIVNPIKKVVSVRICLPAGTFRGDPVKKDTLYIVIRHYIH